MFMIISCDVALVKCFWFSYNVFLVTRFSAVHLHLMSLKEIITSVVNLQKYKLL